MAEHHAAPHATLLQQQYELACAASATRCDMSDSSRKKVGGLAASGDCRTNSPGTLQRRWRREGRLKRNE